jgi:SLOG-like protein
MKPGDIIFLSASVPYRKHWIEDAKPVEIEEAIVSVARAVFARQGRLLFGGHPSVSPLVAAVAGEYFPNDAARVVRPVITFQSKFFEKVLPDKTWEMVGMGWSTIEWTPKSPATDRRSDREASLDEMRAWMLLAPETPKDIIERNQLRPPRAMIAVGGMEGVRDEAAMFLRSRARWDSAPRRVYAFGSGGGAAARLLEPKNWQGLWPEHEPDTHDLEVLHRAWSQNDIVNLEQRWWDANPATIPKLPLQPYTAMAQWLLDTALEFP